MKYDLGRITSGIPFTNWCDRHGWVPSDTVSEAHEEGGDRDEILSFQTHDCGEEVFQGRPTFLGHRRPAHAQQIIEEGRLAA